MSSDAKQDGVETATKEGKADRAAKILKPSKGKDGSSNITTKKLSRPPSTVSMAHSMATSQSRQENRRMPETALENTFKMTPDQKFPEGAIRAMLKDVLTANLSEVDYEPTSCRQLSKSISDDVKNRVKELHVQRYKIICVVHIGQLANQAMRVGSRCLWDTNYDTYTSYQFKNGSLFAVATVFGVYFE